MNIASMLRTSALAYGDLPAVAVGNDIVHSYAELYERSQLIGWGLRNKYDLPRGERVAIVAPNCREYLELVFGIWYAGLVAVPCNSKLHENEFAYLLESSGARVCFGSPEQAAMLDRLRERIASLEDAIVCGSESYAKLVEGELREMADVGPSDPAWLFYTSGTTGRPKGATLTHHVLLAQTMNYFVDVDSVGPGDSMIHGAPLSHGSGLYALPHVAKAAVNVTIKSDRFEPSEIFDLLGTYRGVSMFLAPTMLTRLTNAPERLTANLANLKTIVYGGAPMYVEDTIRALEAFGPKLVQIYGQGESPMTITGLSRYDHARVSHPRFDARLASVGVTRLGCEVKVVDSAGVSVPLGEPGEILVRGDTVMAGYWNDPEATAETLRGGWLHTGDVGSFDEDGYLTLRDRAKDMIISGGVNIYPREIEEVLLRHPGLLEVSVVGRSHAEWGEEVVAVVVTRPGAVVDERELDQLCLDNIARFKRPKAYVFAEDLPKNNYGKILKRELRERIARLGALT